MWIFCCGMRRAGSTLQYQLTSDIVESKGIGKAMGWITPQQFSQMEAKHATKEGYLVVKCHSYIEEAAELLSRRRAKAVYVYRDVRDVVVSAMKKNRKPFWHLVLSGFVEMVLDEYSQWTDVDNILVSRYETMVLDLREEVLRVAGHLGVGLGTSLADELSDRYTLDKQRQRIRAIDYKNQDLGEEADLYDPASLLHRNHIHSGQSGQWRTELSRFQVALLEYIAYDWLIDRGYSVSQTWANRRVAGVGYSLYRISSYAKKSIRKLVRYQSGSIGWQ